VPFIAGPRNGGSPQGLAQAPAPAPKAACKQSKVNCRQNIADDENNANANDSTKSDPEERPGTQDNSFLVEEAYNQEFGVVQHMQSFQRLWNSKDRIYTFTQERPLPRPRHQLSLFLPKDMACGLYLLGQVFDFFGDNVQSLWR
jgi:hypothetical protein